MNHIVVWPKRTKNLPENMDNLNIGITVEAKIFSNIDAANNFAETKALAGLETAVYTQQTTVSVVKSLNRK